MEPENKYLPELMAEKDSLDPSFTHAMQLLTAGKRASPVLRGRPAAWVASGFVPLASRPLEPEAAVGSPSLALLSGSLDLAFPSRRGCGGERPAAAEARGGLGIS